VCVKLGSFMLMKVYRFRVSANMVLKVVFGSDRMYQQDEETSKMRSFPMCTFHRILLG